jgi:DNA-binding winged helix-turn-helix (wHTH) protein
VGLQFCGYQFDPAQRELRHRGELVATQPQVFDLLAYLIEHRDRVVGKQELLSAVWPDAAVTEGSLQRSISLARAALGRAGVEVIRTFPRRGYRFVAEVA